jgi:DNA-binding NarL/FixJ family response regulator
MIKLLLIDKQTLFRKAFKQMLESRREKIVCYDYDHREDLFSKISEIKPDLIMLELNPDQNEGPSEIKKIRKRNKEVPILILSPYTNPELIQSILDEGANGYVSKQNEPDEIFKAMQMVLRGERYIENNIASTPFIETEKYTLDGVFLEKPVFSLSNREREIFNLLGKEFSRKEIAAQLNISTQTVSTHIERIKNKLSFDSSHRLVCFSIRYQSKLKNI